MNRGLKWLLDRLIITAIAAVVIGGGTWVALNTTWFKAPRRGKPVGEMSPEEIRLRPAVRTREISVGVLPPEGWLVVEVKYAAETREAIAISEIEIRTGSGRIVAREEAMAFADGDRTLISFPVLTRTQRIAISGRFAMQEPEDATIHCRVRYFKLGPDAALLRRTAGRWEPGAGLADDGRTRDGVSGLYAHALPAADFRERLAELPFESPYVVAVNGTPPPSLRAARGKARVPDGPCIWLRGEEAWLLEAKDGRTWLVDANRAEAQPGRFVRVAAALREQELASRRPPLTGTVRAGGLTVTVENLMETVRRLDAEGREFDGLRIRDR